MNEEPVTILDRNVLKVLSTDTRMDILKILSEGKRNPSFVAKRLGKRDATIVEHLKIMKEAGLVKKLSAPGKKWVFYSLTEKGKGIVSSKSRRLVIILSSSFISFGLGAGILATQFYISIFSAKEAAPMLSRAPEMADAVSGAVEVVPIITTRQILLYTAIGLIALSLVGFYFYKKSKRDSYEWKTN